MQITVRYFASIREALGLAAEQVQTTQATVAGLRGELIVRGGDYAEALALQRPMRVALDQVMCADENAAALHDGAEVAFFPPVTGG